MQLKSKGFFQNSPTAPGSRSFDSKSRSGKALPFMFNYHSDDRRNRAMVRLGKSDWSNWLSFEAIGSNTEVVLGSTERNEEIIVGLSVEEGEGKYKLCNVVSFAPRFILSNGSKEDLNIRQPGSSVIIELKAGTIEPLHFLQKRSEKHLTVCFPGIDEEW